MTADPAPPRRQQQEKIARAGGPRCGVSSTKGESPTLWAAERVHCPQGLSKALAVPLLSLPHRPHGLFLSTYKGTLAACSTWQTEFQDLYQLLPPQSFSLCLYLFVPLLIHPSISCTMSTFQEAGWVPGIGCDAGPDGHSTCPHRAQWGMWTIKRAVTMRYGAWG